MRNEIWCGDCAKAMDRIPNNSIDLTVTSPPYDDLREYNGYVFDFEPIARQLWRVTKEGGVVVWVVGDKTENGSETGSSFRQALYFQKLGFNLETMIYEQSGTGAKGCNYLYWQTFEFMFVLSKGKLVTSNLIEDRKNLHPNSLSKGRSTVNGSGTPTKVIPTKYGRRSNIWRYSVGHANKDNEGYHPAPFPKELASDHIISWSNPGDLVLDPMCGSGTTLKMAKELGRDYLGIDISQEYCDLSQKRVDGARVLLPGMDIY